MGAAPETAGTGLRTVGAAPETAGTGPGTAGDRPLASSGRLVGTYDELVTAATVGLSRRPLPGAAGALPGDAADALLTAAARQVVARRAGMLPARGVVAPPPMAADGAPELPARAAQVLRQASHDTDLLADLLTAAAGAGYRAPAPLLPALLDAAARTVALRPAVTATLGSSGRWLAAHRPEWARITGTGPDAAGGDDAGSHDAGSRDPRAWETGTRAQRMAYLAALRDRDPAAARELLAAGWSREAADERAALLAVLSRGRSAADEDFLEAALSDRAREVREVARGVLARMPGSGLNQRAARRALGVLRLGSDGRRRWLEASVPDGPPEPDLARDGIAGSPPGTGIGAGAWLVTQLIAAAPLGEWSQRLGLAPREIVALPVEGDLGVDVHAGWRLAAVRQRSAEWAVALLSGDVPLMAPGRPQVAWAGNHELAAVLDPAARAALAAGVFTRVTREARELAGTKPGNRASATAIAEITAWPGPWPDAAADLVLRMVAASLPAQGAVRVLQALVAAAARNVPVTGPRDYAAELTRMTHSPDCAYPWLAILRRAADTLALRRAFDAALDSGPHG